MDRKIIQQASIDGEARKTSLTWFYIVVGGLSLLLMTILTPPFQVPDEPQHFYRSYQISRLELRPEVRDGKAGGVLPSSLPGLVETHLGTLVHHTSRPHEAPARPLAQTMNDVSQALAPETQQFVEFGGSAMYAPLAYIPQAAAIAVGRAAGWSPLVLLWAARLANASAAFALIAWSISALGASRGAAIALALLPMTLFMMASASPDALTIAGGFVIAALVSRFVELGRWGSKDLALWVLGGLLLCAVKVVYLPLMLAGLAALLAPAQSSGQLRTGVASQTIGALLVCGITAFWFWWRPSGVVGTGFPAGVDAAGQIAFLRESPLVLLKLVPRTLYGHWEFLLDSFIGRLGWLNLRLPAWLHAGAIAALFCGFLLQSARPGAATPRVLGTLWVFMLGSAALGLIVLAHYVGWTPVGSYSAKGVQGRYFLPMLPLMAVALSWSLRTPPAIGGNRRLCALLMFLCAAVALSTMLEIARAYAL